MPTLYHDSVGIAHILQIGERCASAMPTLRTEIETAESCLDLVLSGKLSAVGLREAREDVLQMCGIDFFRLFRICWTRTHAALTALYTPRSKSR